MVTRRSRRAFAVLFALLLLPAAVSATWSVIAVDLATGRIVIASAIIIGSVILINSARHVKVKTQPLQAVPDGDD